MNELADARDAARGRGSTTRTLSAVAHLSDNEGRGVELYVIQQTASGSPTDQTTKIN